MIKEAVATGATIEEAQQAAVLALNAPISAEVQFEIVSFPEKKKFGLFGGKQAEVKAFYEAKDEARPAKQAKDKPKSDKKQKAVAEQKAPKQKVPEKEEILTPVSIDECPDGVKTAYNYLKEIIVGIGVNESTIDVTKGEKEYFFNITSEEDYSILIGRRGETLDSIQYLVRLVANRGKNEEDISKISLNIGNYRQKREITLKEIANKTAAKVKKYGRSIALDPMNPFERRIIHTEISSIEDVVSYSVGADAERKVIIALAEGAKATHAGKSYGRGNNRGGYRGGNRGGNRGHRDNYSAAKTPAASDVPSRAPRSDAEGLSRYGKIQPKED